MYAKDSNEIVDRREMLTIKAKTLAAEARIIKSQINKSKRRSVRRALLKALTDVPAEAKKVVLSDELTEEQKDALNKALIAKFKEHFRALRSKARKYGPLEHEMYRHRIDVVRLEARATHLAIGLIRGRSVAEMEPVRLKDKRSVAVAEAAEKKAWGMVAKYGPKQVVAVAVEVTVAEQVAVSA